MNSVNALRYSRDARARAVVVVVAAAAAAAAVVVVVGENTTPDLRKWENGKEL